MKYEWHIGLRYLRSQHRDGFVSFVASMSAKVSGLCGLPDGPPVAAMIA